MEKYWTIAQMAASKGYWQRLDMPRLLNDLRQYPGCERVQIRTLNNYIYGRTRMPMTVGIALSAILGVPIDAIDGGVK